MDTTCEWLVTSVWVFWGGERLCSQKEERLDQGFPASHPLLAPTPSLSSRSRKGEWRVPASEASVGARFPGTNPGQLCAKEQLCKEPGAGCPLEKEPFEIVIWGLGR